MCSGLLLVVVVVVVVVVRNALTFIVSNRSFVCELIDKLTQIWRIFAFFYVGFPSNVSLYSPALVVLGREQRGAHSSLACITHPVAQPCHHPAPAAHREAMQQP